MINMICACILVDIVLFYIIQCALICASHKYSLVAPSPVLSRKSSAALCRDEGVLQIGIRAIGYKELDTFNQS